MTTVREIIRMLLQVIETDNKEIVQRSVCRMKGKNDAMHSLELQIPPSQEIHDISIRN